MVEINFEDLRADLSFEEKALMANENITTIPIRNPNKMEFFRVREGKDWVMPLYLLELKDENETYAVHPQCLKGLLEMGVARKVNLHTLMSNTGVFFLSGIPIPQNGETENTWNRSRAMAYVKAETKWIRIKADKSLGAYREFSPEGVLPEPEWPAKIENIIMAVEIAFRDHVIDNYDHPIIKRIRGMV